MKYFLLRLNSVSTFLGQDHDDPADSPTTIITLSKDGIDSILSFEAIRSGLWDGCHSETFGRIVDMTYIEEAEYEACKAEIVEVMHALECENTNNGATP